MARDRPYVTSTSGAVSKARLEAGWLPRRDQPLLELVEEEEFESGIGELIATSPDEEEVASGSAEPSANSSATVFVGSEV